MANTLNLVVYIDAQGEPYWADAFQPGVAPSQPPLSASGRSMTCVESAVSALPFEATGSERTLGVRLERGRSLRMPKGFVRVAPRETTTAQTPAAASTPDQ